MDFFNRKTNPGDIIDFETIYKGLPELNPDLRDVLSEDSPEFLESLLADAKEGWLTVEGECDRPGQFVTLDYTTDVYEDGVTYKKSCNVYLPYGYDPEDKEKSYNVMYHQHGNTCEPDLFKRPGLKLLFDRLFALEGVEPCIMVFTTYYFDVKGDAEERTRSGSVPAGDGNWPGVKPNFWKEVVQDIIPAVELKFNTYLTDGSAEAIKATRDHRSFGGYSRGCVCTWYMIHNAFEYFRYYVPMSCMTTGGKTIQDKLTDEEVIEYLSAPMKANPELPFFIYALNGGEKDVQPMNPQMRALTKALGFSYGQDPVKNNIYYAVSNYFHTDILAPEYYYNALPVMFK